MGCRVCPAPPAFLVRNQLGSPSGWNGLKPPASKSVWQPDAAFLSGSGPIRDYHSSIMASDRAQRRLIRLLDQIKQEAEHQNWCASTEALTTRTTLIRSSNSERGPNSASLRTYSCASTVAWRACSMVSVTREAAPPI